MKEELHNESEIKEVSVYANPKDGKLYVNTLLPPANLRVEILDVTNHLVMSKKIENDEMVIDLNDWNSGFYKLMVFSDERLCLAKRIVKTYHHRRNYMR